MGKVKHTKNELRTQREALARFTRYLPTLQLKKQQLQAEVTQIQQMLDERRRLLEETRREVDAWARLFAEPVDVAAYVRSVTISERPDNIAGVAVTVLEDVALELDAPDLYGTPPWLDDGLDAARDLVRHELALQYLERQHDALQDELRRTTQRVNLFEKVKIPESKQHIREIRIFLGDQEAAAVGRAKVAKARSVSR
jgi:V/A-type H+-transporting ATPase subunit D